jgi:ribosomal protein L24
MKRGLKKGAVVEVISGGCKGQRGRVLGFAADVGWVLVEKVNVRRKSQKRRDSAGGASGWVEVECGLHASNLKVVPEDGTHSV